MSFYIFNIPHSSTYVPFTEGFIGKSYLKEIELLTDHATDIIFNVEGSRKMICPFSRVFCDVERFPDSREEMEKYGMGVFYTHTDKGELMRELSADKRAIFMNAFYYNYHTKLEKLIHETIKMYKHATIVDCHSFTNTPFNRDLDKTENRPDICIGTDLYHTPIDLENNLVYYFQKQGFSVSVNSPYKGCLVPSVFLHRNKKVQAVMIEVNRNLYMTERKVLKRKTKALNKIISGFFQ